jgi:hypothetical protein
MMFLWYRSRETWAHGHQKWKYHYFLSKNPLSDKEWQKHFQYLEDEDQDLMRHISEKYRGITYEVVENPPAEEIDRLNRSLKSQKIYIETQIEAFNKQYDSLE